MTMPSAESAVVGFRMQEWQLGEQSPRLQASVRKVLSELHPEALLRLKDKRLEVRVAAGSWHHSVWAYFPIWPRWTITVQEMAARGITFNREIAGQIALGVGLARAYGNAHAVRQADARERVRIVRELLPRSDTRVLLVFRGDFESESAKTFEDHLRDHLGHVLLYLREPKANNDCAAATKEWRRCVRAPNKAPRRRESGRVKTQ
jgi:hypothetical protein